MRRALTAAALALCLLPGAATGVAQASPRLDTAAAELRRDTVYVSPDMQDAFPPAVARDLRERIAELDVPFDVRAVALPLVDTDESGGDDLRVLHGLADRLPERPRVLVLVDSLLQIELLPQRVGREIALRGDARFGDTETAADLTARLGLALEEIATAPVGESYGYDRPEGDPRPVFRLDDDEDEEDGWGWSAALALWGTGAGLGALAWAGRRPWRHGWAGR